MIFGNDSKDGQWDGAAGGACAAAGGTCAAASEGSESVTDNSAMALERGFKKRGKTPAGSPSGCEAPSLARGVPNDGLRGGDTQNWR